MSVTVDFARALFGDPLPDDCRIATWHKASKHSTYHDAPATLADHEGQTDVYVGAGLVPASLNGANRRFKARECAGIVGVWLDMDIAGGPDH
jgi:hypothetical protein